MVWIIAIAAVVVVLTALAWRSSGKAGPRTRLRRSAGDDAIAETQRQHGIRAQQGQSQFPPSF